MSITIGAYRTALSDLGEDASVAAISEYACWAQLALDLGRQLDDLLDAPISEGYRKQAMALDGGEDFEAVNELSGARINGVLYRAPTGRDAMALVKAGDSQRLAIDAIGAMCELEAAAYEAQPMQAWLAAYTWVLGQLGASVTPTA